MTKHVEGKGIAMNQDVTKQIDAGSMNNHVHDRPTRPRPDERITAYQRRSPALWAGALFVVAGCSAVELADPVASSEQAVYDDQYKLVLPLLENKMGTQTGALPGPGWYTSAVIQNTTDEMAWVTLTAYTHDRNASGSVTQSIKPRENLVFRPDNAGYAGTIGIPLVAAGNFEGTMVVEADHRVTAIAQLSNLEQIATIGGQTVKLGHPDGKASAAYAGLSLKDSGQDLVYPTMKCGYAGKSTTLFVQNVGQTGGTVKLEFTTNKAGKLSKWITLDVNQSTAVGCSDFGVSACSTAGLLGSVSLTDNAANIQLAAVAVEHATPPCPPAAPPAADAVMAHPFHKKTSAPPDAYCSVFKNQFRFPIVGSQSATSGIVIVNASSTSSDIHVTFHGSASPSNPASGHTYFQSFLGIPPDMIAVASPWTGTVGGFPAGGYGWAEIHSPHSIVAQVNELSSVSQSGQLCMSMPDDELFVPSFKSGFPSATSTSAANTKVTLLNVGYQAALITAQFTCRGGSSYTVSRWAPARDTLVLGPDIIPAGLFCAVRLNSPGAQLVGAVEESTEGLSIVTRDSLIYEPARFD